MSFDNEALTWDEDPNKVNRAKSIAKGIQYLINSNGKLSAIEFGCGTGLLSFELKDIFKKITLIDISIGMINVLKKKIEASQIKHFYPIYADLFDGDTHIQKHDVVYTSMTLHHINNTKKAISVFEDLIKDKGYLCIADLEKEDGSFHRHDNTFNGHNGFDKMELIKLLKQYHFDVKYNEVCYEMEKEIDGIQKKFPVFLIIAQK